MIQKVRYRNVHVHNTLCDIFGASPEVGRTSIASIAARRVIYSKGYPRVPAGTGGVPRDFFAQRTKVTADAEQA